jgi:C4-dicarboxylate transporter DctM subunit
MILIGYVTGTSVAQLFLAGVVPGVLIGVLLMIVAYRHAVKHGIAGETPTRLNIGAVARTGISALPALGMPFLIVFGILAGIFTAT